MRSLLEKKKISIITQSIDWKAPRHSLGHSGEEVHQDHLRIPFAAIARFGVACLFRGAGLDNDDGRSSMAFNFCIMASIGHGLVMLLPARTHSEVRHGLGVVEAGVRFKQADADVGGGHLLAGTRDHAVADDKEQLARVGIVGPCDGVERGPDRVEAFGVAGHEADAEQLGSYSRHAEHPVLIHEGRARACSGPCANEGLFIHW